MANKTCIDCGAEVTTMSPRCEPCRKIRLKERQAAGHKKAREKKISKTGSKKRCLKCFQWFPQNSESQTICPRCNAEDGMKRFERVPSWREPLGCWLSNKPITMNYWQD